MVLLMDVARFKYPPHWVKLSMVHRALQQQDPCTKGPRGLVILQKDTRTSTATAMVP
ncbi:hypothetical protein PINS_up005274 [Pythium insidiosum]|nr:hypothetical protein PINS_up005274 [Pythium insidiosum]